jgi:hypothetical protein
MLNYILPPIIIIIGVSILIVFLFRKVQQISTQELLEKEAEKEPEKRMSRIMSAISQFGLKMLERLMQRFKLISLKFHNTSNDWFHSIRERRQNHIDDQRKIMQSQDLKEDDKKEKDTLQQPFQQDIQEEKPVRPLIREAVTNPQIEIKEKSKLEEVLIKRIAVNPRDIEAYERLGDYYMESTNYRDSHECFKQVLMLSPSHYKAKIRIRKIEKLITM